MTWEGRIRCTRKITCTYPHHVKSLKSLAKTQAGINSSSKQRGGKKAKRWPTISSPYQLSLLFQGDLAQVLSLIKTKRNNTFLQLFQVNNPHCDRLRFMLRTTTFKAPENQHGSSQTTLLDQKVVCFHAVRQVAQILPGPSDMLKANMLFSLRCGI